MRGALIALGLVALAVLLASFERLRLAPALVGILLAGFLSPAWADADFVAVEQRNSTDTGWITRQLANPDAGANGLMYFNGATKLPGYVVLGAGLSISSGVLASTVPGNVNADWNATSGGAQILNKPALAAVATTGAYLDLSGRPSLAAVATSGAYSDLSGRPSIPAAQVNSDWSAAAGVAQILNKPALAQVATSGSYADLSGRPPLATVATTGAYADLTGRPAIPAAQVSSDWLASSGVAQILNKPALSAVATSGAYADLSGRPTIPAAQVNADWAAASGVAQVLNKPSLAAVAISGAYSDLSGRPSLAAVATSGAYADLTGKPSIPSGALGAPAARTVALATAYQCTAPASPCFFTVTLQSQSSISLSGTSNNEGAITLGSTAAVASGTGTNVAVYKNNLGGGLVVGLSITSQQANTYTVAVPAGWYVAVRQTAGTGLQVISAFDQQSN